jgi:large subunit ribosomal protein L21
MENQFNVVEINGHQYKVTPGQIIDVEKLNDSAEGSSVDFTKVLFSHLGTTPKVGVPYLSGAKVVAKVIRHDRSKKILVLKRKPGKYVKKNGHRQEYTSLFITEISDGAGQTQVVAKDHKLASKYLK